MVRKPGPKPSAPSSRVIARRNDWNSVRDLHQGPRSMAASRGRIHDRSPIRSPKHKKALAESGPSIHDGKKDKQLEETIMPQGQRIVLASRPVGEPKPSDFRTETYDVPTPGQGEVLLRTIWLSLDPYMRGRMNDAASYAQPVPIGGVMEGGTVSEVIASNNSGFAKGDIVLSRAGWQTHALSDGKGLAKIDPRLAPISTAVGVLGMPGMTAYTGLLDIGKPQAGETVVVAAASGAV